MRYFVSAIFLLFSIVPVLPQQSDSTVVQVGPGAKLHTVIKPSVPLAISILEVDLHEDALSFSAVLANDRLGKGFERVSSMARRSFTDSSVVIAALNADYFGITDPSKPDYFITNQMVMDSEIITFKKVPRSQTGFLADGQPVFGLYQFDAGIVTVSGREFAIESVNKSPGPDAAVLLTDYYPPFYDAELSVLLTSIEMLQTGEQIKAVVERPYEYGAGSRGGMVQLAANGRAAKFVKKYVEEGDTVVLRLHAAPKLHHLETLLGGGPLLIEHGKSLAPLSNAEGLPTGHTDKRHPRTVVGINADTSKYYMIAVDGRAEEYSMGMTLDELAAYVRSIGCYTALNLDGGGSTTLTIRDAVVNRPSDSWGERPAGNGLLLHYTPKDGSFLERIEAEPERVVIPTGGVRLLDIKATDRYGQTFTPGPQVLSWQIDGVDAGVDEFGFIQGNAPGAGILTVEWLGKSDSVELLILPYVEGN